MFDIPTELKKLPSSPGVYLMKDAAETIIYVGKAINLRNRVRNYFQPANANAYKLETMVPLIRSFEYIVTDTELEALILECTLIKKHWPRFNVKLKDDKTYPYIKATLADDFPQVLMVHEFTKDKSRYFGPYTSYFAVNEVMELIGKTWKFRLCNKKFNRDNANMKPCLNFHIGKCAAPCAGKISYEDYAANIREVTEFLEGKHQAITSKLERQMYELSDEMEYEKAGEVKTKIMAIKKLCEKQKLDTKSANNQDIIAVAAEGQSALMQVFYMRSGKLMGREHFMLDIVEGQPAAEILSGFISQYYSGTPFIPREIILGVELPEAESIAAWLSEQRGAKVALHVPKIGEKLKLLNMAQKNADIQLSQFGEEMMRQKNRTEGALLELAKALGLDSSLNRVEIYDISNIQGYESVASMVVYEKGVPKRNDYRKFRIKAVEGANDYASMEEVIRRRFEHYRRDMEEAGKIADELEKTKYIDKAKFSRLPDLIFLDGGKGQTAIAEEIVAKMNLNLPCAGLIKDDDHRTRGIIYQGNEIILPRMSEGFKLITRMQDETHRFAIEYHRKLREKKLSKSALDEIKNIGAARKKALFKRFGSIEKIRYATVEELAETPAMNLRAAQAVYYYFRQ